ncbi:hypothetical protein LINGRAHAP2_LOCUS6420 [Linum grandiflorum]
MGMAQSNPTEKPPQSLPPQPAVHQDDADEEDESVKQLRECSSVYLSLQVTIFPQIPIHPIVS